MMDEPIGDVKSLFSAAVKGAEISQGMEQFARALGAFHRTLLEEGFDEDESFELCRIWLIATVGGMVE